MEQLRERAAALTQYELMDNCGHIPMEEYPGRFVEVVKQFLAAASSKQQAVSSSDAMAPQLVAVGDTTPAAAAGISRAEVVRDSK